MTMKAHTYYIIFGRPPIGGKLLPLPLAAPLYRIDKYLDTLLAIKQLGRRCHRPLTKEVIVRWRTARVIMPEL